MSIRNVTFAIPLLLATGLAGTLLSTPAFAAGEKPESMPPICPKGQVWNKAKKACVVIVSSLAPDEERAGHADRLIGHHSTLALNDRTDPLE